jgi:hypothetical protein
MGSIGSKPPLIVTITGITDRRSVCRATLVNGEFPGPLIQATKVDLSE